MADYTADSDWIDCHALRRDEEARGHGRREREQDSDSVNAWRPRGLLLIEPDGTETLVPVDDAGADVEAQERAAAEAAEAAARAAAEKMAREEAEARAEAEAERKAKEEAERKAKEEAERKAKAEAARKAKEEAKKKAEAEAKAKEEAEARAQAEAAAKKRAEAKAKAEAEAKAKAEAEEKARKEAAAKAEAEKKARQEAERKAKAEAEKKAREEARKKAAEEKARKEAEAKAKKAAEEKARKEAAAKAAAEKKAREAAERKAKAEALKKAKAEAEAKAKAKAEAEAKAKAEAEEKARQEAEAKAVAEQKAREKAERKAREAADAKAEALATLDLGKSFRRLIRETGPISLTQYMGESNTRYYASRDPLGDEGDFITAPEISQMFGELIGLWLADVWVKMGSSDNIHYVELGPGRGTLASDALRTAGRYDFDPHIHFVEGSPALRKLQLEKFPNARHHYDLSTLPEDRPLLIVANEFFDALPIHQLVRAAQGWHEKMVGLDGDDLVFVAGDEPMDSIVPRGWRNASQGTMIETSPAAATVMEEIARRLANQGGVALIIDYGPMEHRAGSTLQALRDHKKVDVLEHPGEADMTAHVDFEMLQDVAKQNGAEVMGLQMQGEWLRQLHIETRLEALKRRSPNETDKLQRQFDRLVADDQMGVLFKVLGICGRRWPFGEGFD